MGLKAYLKDSLLLSAYRRIRQCLGDIRRERQEKEKGRKKVISLVPKGPSRGKALVSYIIDGLLLEPGEQIPKTHTNIWQSVQIAKTFVELGYEVDFIHYTNHSFVPRENYSFFVDVRHNLQRLAPLLNEDCIKIMHIDHAHILFHNAAEAGRLLALQQRRGITLRPRRFEMPNLGIEHADVATTSGNDFTINTFAYAKKKIFKLPVPCGIMHDLPARDYDKIRNHFLWFSSSAPVHKGLDLALDAFKDMPDCHLTVCGPVERDADFVNAYHEELYKTANIDAIGWVPLDSDAFKEVTASCVAVLHLSCSEGGGASVKMCLHTGLIPVVSYESSIDADDFGFVLRECSLSTIKNTIRHISLLPANQLEDRCRQSWEYARRHHTRENFTSTYRRVITEIMEDTQRN
ncbi:glycosyltransferase [uncultured Desulfosarcina sp.]|uniref:glycosyltransferase n=1 Tax=uncultured Desulfosarcina sp. TaxID=218289 RepID=UPI0029C8A879|nr:glycosyltransferase [uncultured Desulfosarcina sp.]